MTSRQINKYRDSYQEAGSITSPNFTNAPIPFQRMKNLLALSFTFFFLNTFSQDTITVIGVGDIMMGTNYPENDLPPDDGAHELEQVESILQNADVTFGNLEGTLFPCFDIFTKQA